MKSHLPTIRPITLLIVCFALAASSGAWAGKAKADKPDMSKPDVYEKNKREADRKSGEPRGSDNWVRECLGSCEKIPGPIPRAGCGNACVTE